MTIQGAINELFDLIRADDVPEYYNGIIQKVIETILLEVADCKTEPQTKVCIRPDQDCKACWKNQICEIRDKEERDRIHKLINDRKSHGKE